MKNDILNWCNGQLTGKIISKETLNHRQLIEYVSGLNVYTNTREAYLRAYEALGIDLINRVPIENAPLPTPVGVIRAHPYLPYNFCNLGVYDTVSCYKYKVDRYEDVYELDPDDLNYSDLLVPVPHSCAPEDIYLRQHALGNVGLYYPMYYTTLFMWGIEFLGYEHFSMAAFMEAGKFHQKFILPAVRKSAAIVEKIADATDSPIVFLHDDLASATGPLFPPAWYDDYIFPHYPEIFKGAKEKGKKIIMVADGNMDDFLEKIVECGVDGIMFENPATNMDKVIEIFSGPGRYLIGGIETQKLTFASPEEVEKMVFSLAKRVRDVPGFAMASGGGIHGNIPMENLESYFDARVEVGATPEGWRTNKRV